MSKLSHPGFSLLSTLAVSGVLLAAHPAQAAVQPDDVCNRDGKPKVVPVSPEDSAGAASSGDAQVMQELIRLLAERYAIDGDDAKRLIDKTRANAAAEAKAKAKAAPRSPDLPPECLDVPPSAAQTATPEADAEARRRTRVIFLPDSEKERIRDEVRKDVMTAAKDENWALPNTFPDWVRRIRLDGDLRVREQFDMFDSKNYPSFVDFNTINTGLPVDTNPPANAAVVPYLNSTNDRMFTQLRLRLGLTAKLSDEMGINLRFGTGNTLNPVSTSQTQGTEFNKYNFLVDRAYMSYHPVNDVWLLAGRMANPWQYTELVYDNDLAFDGFAVHAQHSMRGQHLGGITVGAFPVQSPDLNFPSTLDSTSKTAGRDKWLFGAQLSDQWKPRASTTLKAALAYYHYYQIDGELSDPLEFNSVQVVGNTDGSRSLFSQKGNTQFAIRDARLAVSTDPSFQYFGLASPFRIVDLVLGYDWRHSDDLHVMADIDYARNLAWNSGRVQALSPNNNFGECIAFDSNGSCTNYSYDGGNQAYLVQVKLGRPVIESKGQWSLLAGYRYIESDAVLDAFTDSNFHRGGTNAKGYYLTGNLGFSKNAWLQMRFYSSTEVSAQPFALDILQLDVNARF